MCSTCSLNPIEDDAVVCTAVKIQKGTIELELKRNKGLLHWKVCNVIRSQNPVELYLPLSVYGG